MNVGPTRITIELHPGSDGGTWSARTSVDDTSTNGRMASEIVGSEPRESGALPSAYDPGDCTCLDDDPGCGRDHANE